MSNNQNQLLTDQVAIVTGAARGIGAATAIALAAAGAKVIASDVISNNETLAAIEQIGGTCISMPADVSDRKDVEQVVESTINQFGRIDILVTNAAYSDRQPFHEADLDGFEKTIAVSMWGQYYFLRYVSAQMIRLGIRGSIVCVSSPHAIAPIPGAMAYNMAKAAVDQMARTAACELAEHRIRVNLIHPGWTNTPGERKFFREEELSTLGGELPLGRLAESDEIARGVVFLCDPASSYITGSTLTIDGGVLLPNNQKFRMKDRPDS